MNFVADESVDGPIVYSLRSTGHTVAYIAETDSGIDDDEVFRKANAFTAVLITEDKDFGEIVFRQKRVSGGVVLVRLDGLTPDTKAQIVCAVVREHEPDLPENFTVITPGTVRIRRQK